MLSLSPTTLPLLKDEQCWLILGCWRLLLEDAERGTAWARHGAQAFVSHSDPSDKHCCSAPRPNLVTLIFAQTCAVALETGAAAGPGAGLGLPKLMPLTLSGNFWQERHTDLPGERGGWLSAPSRSLPVDVRAGVSAHAGGSAVNQKSTPSQSSLNLSQADTRQGTQTVLKKCTLSSHPPRTLLHLPRVPRPSWHLPGTQSHPAPSLELASHVPAHILPLSGSPVGYL